MTLPDSQDKPKLQTAGLKSCPFCGAPYPVLLARVGAWGFVVECSKCHATGEPETVAEDAARKWNVRVVPPDLVRQTTEPMGPAGRYEWFREASEDLEYQGARHVRVSFKPNSDDLLHGICLCEGWYKEPDYMPEPLFNEVLADE